MKQKLFIVATSIFISFASLQAQVTIGSDVAPNAGALLDLKENILSGKNSDKGLGLPRVELTSLTNLYPMFEPDGSQYKQSGVQYVKTDTDKKHAGLMVYNTNVFKNGNDVYCTGLYLWDGAKWNPIAQTSPTTPKPSISMIDGDGNQYEAIWIHDQCDIEKGLYWTTKNLWSTSNGASGAFSSGNEPTMNYGLYAVGGGYSLPPTIYVHGLSNTINITFKEGTTTPPAQKVLSQKDFAARFGLLYTWDAATTACPQGWRLPTIQEWKDLESYLGGPTVSGARLRANKLYYYQGNDKSFDPSANPSSTQWGKNDVANISDIGFNAVPSGVVSTGKAGSNGFGAVVDFWIGGQKSFCYLSYDATGLGYTENYTSNGLFSIRCVKGK